MSEHFLRFKRRILIITIIKSAAVALSLGMLATALLLLLTTHGAIAIAPYFSFIVGGALLLISGAFAYFLLKRSDGQTARELDEHYSLDERVRTMLEYRDASGAIYELQREDTERKLSELKPAGFGTRRLWIYITAAALSAVLLTTSVILIPEEQSSSPSDVPFSITKLQLIAMEELIAYVDGSDMQSPYKEGVTLALTELLAELKLADTVAERDAALKVAVDEIYSQTDSSSSAVEIINALAVGGSASVKSLANALNHYTWTRGNEWNSFTNRMTAFRETFVHADAGSDAADGQAMLDETKEMLSEASEIILSALVRSQADSEDILYIALLNFVQREGGTDEPCGIGTLADKGGEMSYAELQQQIDAIFIKDNLELSRALDILSTNTTVGEYAMTRLSELFDYKLPTMKRPETMSTSSSGSGSGGDNENSGGNGAIGGGTEYGSDDLVLDPFTGEYVEYGEIFNRYYTIIFNKLQGDGYTDEEKDALEKYFDILYGGFH